MPPSLTAPPSLAAPPPPVGGVLAVVAGLCWGVLAPFSKLMFGIDVHGQRFDAESLTVARAIWPLPLFALFVWFARPRGLHPSRAELAQFALAALLVGFGFNYAYQLAVEHTSADHVILLQGFAPLCLAAIDALVFRRPLDAPRLLALGLGAAGVVCVARGDAGSGASSALGDALMLVWIAAFAGYSIVTRNLTRRYAPPFVIAVTWGGGFALVALTGAGLIPFAVRHTLASPELALLVIAGIVGAGAIVAPAAHAASVRVSGVTIATAGSQYGVIVTGVVLSYVLLGERLAPLSIAGAILLLSGLACTLVPARANVP